MASERVLIKKVLNENIKSLYFLMIHNRISHTAMLSIRSFKFYFSWVNSIFPINDKQDTPRIHIINIV